MNPPKVSDRDDIDFLIATPRACSGLEAARVSAAETLPPAHDAFTRLLHRLEPDATTLWQEAVGQVVRERGILVVDDSTLDKPYAKKIERVNRHGSGKHHAVVDGINLITLLWSEGDRHVPVDYRVYDKAGDGLTKNDHFQGLLNTTRERGFQPQCVVFDSGYSRLTNLKWVNGVGGVWLTRLKANRLVNPERQGQRPVARVETGPDRRLVYLKGYGLIRLFVIETWTIEHYHRGIKQYCGVERAQVRAARAQRNPIGLALRTFLRLESYCYHRGISGFEAKQTIIREAVRAYLRVPIYQLISTA